jgi:hypothetical protein
MIQVMREQKLIMGAKAGFFSESAVAFVISSSTRIFYFPELENLIF